MTILKINKFLPIFCKRISAITLWILVEGYMLKLAPFFGTGGDGYDLSGIIPYPIFIRSEG
jgi:hypothetical protein